MIEQMNDKQRYEAALRAAKKEVEKLEAALPNKTPREALFIQVLRAYETLVPQATFDAQGKKILDPNFYARTLVVQYEINAMKFLTAVPASCHERIEKVLLKEAHKRFALKNWLIA